jgi:hypothetical protein
LVSFANTEVIAHRICAELAGEDNTHSIRREARNRVLERYTRRRGIEDLEAAIGARRAVSSRTILAPQAKNVRSAVT